MGPCGQEPGSPRKGQNFRKRAMCRQCREHVGRAECGVWFQLPFLRTRVSVGGRALPQALVPDPCLPWKVSYAIGVAAPLSISIFTYGTSKKTERELLDVVNKNFDLRPGVIVRYVCCLLLPGQLSSAGGEAGRTCSPSSRASSSPGPAHAHKGAGCLVLTLRGLAGSAEANTRWEALGK